MAFDVLVIGGGPAGLSAALNVRARGGSALVISNPPEENPLWRAERVENHLGMPGMTGAELLTAFRRHAEAAGVELRTGKVLSTVRTGNAWYAAIGNDMVYAAAVVLAAGVSRGVKFPGEAEFLGRGVSYCATCDGMLYRNRPVAVVGRSAGAPEEAAYLQRIGCQVTYVAAKRPEELPPEIPFVAGSRLEIVGDGQVRALRVGETEVPCEGVFLLRPTMTLTDLLPGLAAEGGHITVDRDMSTSVPGVFAAGDCTGLPHQVSKAVGEGQVAGHRASEYVDRLNRQGSQDG